MNEPEVKQETEIVKETITPTSPRTGLRDPNRDEKKTAMKIKKQEREKKKKLKNRKRNKASRLARKRSRK